MRKIETIRASLEILSLPPFLTMAELKARYHLLAMELHPDYGGSVHKMAQINEAYAIIKDYMEQFKFTFSDEELGKQFPQEVHASRFRF